MAEIIKKDEYARFLALREKTLRAVGEALAEYPFCKSYEGIFEIYISYPSYFEDETAESGPMYFCIRLNCYVIGAHRYYEWCGKTFAEALDKAEKAIDEMIGEGDGNG